MHALSAVKYWALFFHQWHGSDVAATRANFGPMEENGAAGWNLPNLGLPYFKKGRILESGARHLFAAANGPCRLQPTQTTYPTTHLYSSID